MFFYTDTFLNITKRREEIRYKTSLPVSSSSIAYVKSRKDISSNLCISIHDRSSFLVENREVDDEALIIEDSISYLSSTDNFVITDIFTDTAERGSPRIPLFYQHVISSDIVPRDEDGYITEVTFSNLSILDNNLQPIEQPIYLLDSEKGILYHNFFSTYESSSDYDFYYIKYTVQVSGISTVYVDLLDLDPIFREATFEDLDHLMRIIPTRKVYLVEEEANEFKITFPYVGDFGFNPTSAMQIQLLPPIETDISHPWFLRVMNGEFSSIVNGTRYKYRLAEFSTQSWKPFYPYKYSGIETSTILSKSLLKLDHRKVYQDEEEALYVNIEILDKDRNCLAAYTTDPDKVGETSRNSAAVFYQKWNRAIRAGVRSIASKMGILQIEGIELDESDIIESEYYFEEENYDYVFVNFNPIGNQEILSGQVVIFLESEAPLVEKTKTLYYLKLDSSGRVTESDWPSFDNETQKVGSNYLYFQSSSSVPDYWKTPYDIFVDTYSVEGDGSFLILGEISVHSSTVIDDLIAFDSRCRGGGILENQEEDIIQNIQSEAQWYNDIGYWDGLPYPGNASYFVEIPLEIMDGISGNFLQNEIKDIVNKHTALGIYPVIHAYSDIGITLSGIIPGIDGNSLTIEWNSINEAIFNIYYMIGTNPPWTLSNTVPISYNEDGMSYTLSGLESNTLYTLSIIPGILEDEEFIPLLDQSIGPGTKGAGGIEIIDTYPRYAVKTLA